MMRAMRAAMVAVLVACSGAGPAKRPPMPARAPHGALRTPAAFDVIADRGERSQALFLEIGRVLTHPRCVNCHPADDSPRQGDLHALHDPPVLRGAAGRGLAALPCSGCHQDRNIALARVHGAPDWHLAPRQMAWLDRTPGQICQQLADPAQNGGRTLAQVHDHLAHDAIVAWGWAPGADREPAPGTQAQLAALFQAWIDNGAVCPQETAR
jgi:hypothetical protein